MIGWLTLIIASRNYWCLSIPVGFVLFCAAVAMGEWFGRRRGIAQANARAKTMAVWAAMIDPAMAPSSDLCRRCGHERLHHFSKDAGKCGLCAACPSFV